MSQSWFRSKSSQSQWELRTLGGIATCRTAYLCNDRMGNRRRLKVVGLDRGEHLCTIGGISFAHLGWHHTIFER